MWLHAHAQTHACISLLIWQKLSIHILSNHYFKPSNKIWDLDITLLLKKKLKREIEKKTVIIAMIDKPKVNFEWIILNAVSFLKKKAEKTDRSMRDHTLPNYYVVGVFAWWRYWGKENHKEK